MGAALDRRFRQSFRSPASAKGAFFGLPSLGCARGGGVMVRNLAYGAKAGRSDWSRSSPIPLGPLWRASSWCISALMVRFLV